MKTALWCALAVSRLCHTLKVLLPLGFLTDLGIKTVIILATPLHFIWKYPKS